MSLSSKTGLIGLEGREGKDMLVRPQKPFDEFHDDGRTRPEAY